MEWLQIRELKFGTGGNLVTSAKWSDGKIRIYYMKTGALIRNIIVNEDTVECITVLSGGIVASGSRDGEIRIWNPVNGSLIRKIKRNGLLCIKGIADLLEERIASICYNKNTVKILNTRIGL